MKMKSPTKFDVTFTARTPEEFEKFKAEKNRYITAIMGAAEMELGENQHDGIKINARVAAMSEVMIMLLGNFPEMREMALKTIWDGSKEMAEYVDEQRRLGLGN
jgi:hypothetical protein